MANRTLIEYRELFKRYLQESADADDVDNQYYPDEQINAFLNAGQIDIVRELAGTLNFFKTTDTLDATTGDIALPDDFLTAMNIKFTNNPTLVASWNLEITDEDRMDQMYPWWRTNITTPYPVAAIMVWRPAGQFINLYPPVSATISDAIFVNYAVRPDDMADDDDESAVMAFFPELQQTLLPFAALRNAVYFEAGEADDQAAKYEALYQKGLRQARFIINTNMQRRWTYGSGF
jgi:hypothetical protein